LIVGSTAHVTDWNHVWFEGDVNMTIVLWLILGVATLALLAANGHERRFLATTYEEREWMILNADLIRREIDLA
jgi:hypothetical protein